MCENKKRINFGFAAIAVAFIFFFNPNINIIDFLPDIIGYVILCAALSRLADLNESVADAKKYFRYMIIADGAKLLSIFWVFGLLDDSKEQNTGVLLLTFIFSVAEVLILVPAYSKLFDGLMGLGYRHENNSVMAKRKPSASKNRTEKIKSYTLFFVIFKSALSVLPEFTVLSTQSYDESAAGNTIYLYEFVPLLRSLAFALVLIFGLIWLVKAIRYFSVVASDGVFLDSLEAEYRRSILPKPGIFIQRSVKNCFILFGAAAILCVDFRVDYFNLIPDLIPALLFICGIALLGKKSDRRSLMFGGFSLYAVISAIALAIEYMFYSKYYYGATLRDEAAHRLYNVMLVSSVADAIAFLAAAACVILCLLKIINLYTGFSMHDDEESRKRVEEVHAEYRKKLILPCVAAVISAVSDVFCDFALGRLGFAMLINFVTSVFFAAVLINAMSKIYEGVQIKYMLD